jgi:hypothetical protein
MPKGGFWNDTFEQLVEMGKSTVKKSAKGVTQTFSPIKLVEKVIDPNSQSPGLDQEKVRNKKNNTPLDFEKLQEKYKKQDEEKMLNPLRNRLFQLVKQGEEKSIYEKKKEREEKKQAEAYQQEQKKKQEQQKKQQEQAAVAPQGKQRRSIFSPKKVAKREQVEVKPASGKQ